MTSPRARGLGTTAILPLAALVVTACGGSSTPKAAPSAAATSRSARSTTSPAAPVAPRLRIRSPRRGAHVTATVAVRVSLTGARAPGAGGFRYVLDGGRALLGPARLLFHGLTSGHHRLLVALAARPSVKAAVTFTVAAPPPVTPPVTSTASTASAVTPTATATSTTAAPAPTTTAPAPTTTSTTAPAGGIPQGANAGDADADNHGGPSDGDGNV